METGTKGIADILRDRDAEKYKAIIERATNNGYHDYKFDDIPGHPEYGECDDPKLQLIRDLSAFPELSDIVKGVMDGKFDERADAQDAEKMRGWLIADGAPDAMFDEMKFRRPTKAERLHKRAINN